VVLFEMVTGQLPFAGDTPIATAVKRLTQAPPAPDELRPGLDKRWVEVIGRCLARRPEDRFDSIRQVREALQGAPLPPLTSRTAAAAPPTTPAGAGTGARRRRQIWLLAAVTLVLCVALTHAVLRVRKSLASPFAGLSGVERRAVAVVPFRNLAQREEFDWLSVALAEMVASEIRTTRGLRAVAGESVARAGVDLELGSSDDLGADELERLRGRLGADYVVAGSFAVLGSGASANVRLAVRIEDARSRETVGETVESGTEQQLFELVSRIGERLRELLGSRERAVEVDPGAVTPRSPRAARLYSEGLLKLRAFEPQAALDLLQQAREAEPLNPMVRSALASTWAALGFEQRAREEAEEALRMGSALPAEERFAVDALAAELRRDWTRAGEIWAQLWSAFPDSLDYGLKLGRAQLESGRADLALATLASLRELPEPDGGNPRIDLAEAAAAGAASDFVRQLAASGRAAAKAEALGAPLLVAEARVREAEALRRLGRPVEAEAATAAARALYGEAGDRVGEAAALTILAGALFDRGDLPAARAANEQALASYRDAGDRNGVARTLNGLAVLARNLGDPAGARALYVEAMSVLSEIDDRRGLAYTQSNLSAVAAEEGLLSEARAAAESAFQVLRELGDQSGEADALLNLGIIEHRLGSLDSARIRLQESLKLKRELALLPGEGAALVALAELELDRGELVESAGHLESAVALGAKIESPALLSNALAVQGELAIEQARLELARQRLDESLALRVELGRAGKVEESRVALARLAIEVGEPRAALAQLDAVLTQRPAFRPALLASEVALLQSRALAALGRAVDARAAFARAELTSEQIENPRLAFLAATVAAAIERSGAGRGVADSASLDALAADARRRGFQIWAAELEILAARRVARKEPSAALELDTLATECARRGLVRLERLARESAAAD
jgi:tetratricopeptide (TPR) repeat protein